MTIEISKTIKLFNLAEAREHLPLVASLTEKHRIELAPIQARLNRMLSNDPRRAPIEQAYENVVDKWRAKVEHLGASVHGLWVVEFDVGEGVLCWRYPELSLSYIRLHEQSFASRSKLKDYIDKHDPDWA